VELTEAGREWLEARGYTVLVDRPYAGTLVPRDFYRSDPRVHSIMIEVNRALYMDEPSGQKSPRFAEMRQLITALVAQLAAVAAT
jgi:N-formylglutamate amidohydrolase